MRRASAVAAGSALGLSAAGCAEEKAEAATFVCIAPTVAYPTVPGMTYIKASQIGCALDCDLQTGKNRFTGGAATDDAPKINAAMAGASAANPMTLILDGAALISGLFLPAAGSWGIQGQGCSTGFFIQSGANADGIHNGGPTAAQPMDPGVSVPGIAVPARGSNVTLSDFVLNGNRGDGHTGDSTTGAVQGGAGGSWYDGINLLNLNNITIQNVTVVNTPAYHIRLSNVGNVTVNGVVTNSAGFNTDGMHFNGPANDLTISNCNLTTGDDAIALNCPEGYTGNIERVTVTNCVFNCYSLMRLDTINGTGNPTFTISGVSVSGCTGTCARGAFLIGEGDGSKPHAVDGLTIANCTLATPAVLDLSANFGTIAVSGVTMTPNGLTQDVGYAFARTIQYDVPIKYVGTSLTITNCAIVRTGDYPVAALILLDGSSIGTIEFNGFAVQDPAGSAYAASPSLLNVVKGTLGSVVLDAVDSTHMTAPASIAGLAAIGSVSGAGVLATKWPFPDAVMANGTPYLSASSGQASIKTAGVVMAYP